MRSREDTDVRPRRVLLTASLSSMHKAHVYALNRRKRKIHWKCIAHKVILSTNLQASLLMCHVVYNPNTEFLCDVVAWTPPALATLPLSGHSA